MIIVAGEALIDLVPEGSQTLRAHCGGGPFNTARWLSRVGAPVSFLGSFSDDAFGERLRGALAHDGVCLDLLTTTSRPTTLALAEVDGAGAAQYRFYAQGTAAAALETSDALARLPARFDALHVGSLGLVLQPIAQAVTALVRSPAAHASLVMLDPNIRPSLIGARAEYLERFSVVLGHVDVLKVSIEDLEWLVPGRPARAAARELLAKGPRVVVLTTGADGAVVIAEHQEITIPAASVKVADTIGAGDAFNAGFLARWLADGLTREQLGRVEDVARAARFGCVVAARACAHYGAAPPAVVGLA